MKNIVEGSNINIYVVNDIFKKMLTFLTFCCIICLRKETSFIFYIRVSLSFCFWRMNMGHYFTNENLPSNVRKTNCFVLGKEFIFFTDNGVFSKDGLDFGSRLLLENIPLEEVGAKVLDMGCGYGVIGVIINKLTDSHVDMVDVNLRAIHLAPTMCLNMLLTRYVLVNKVHLLLREANNYCRESKL